MSLRIYNTLGRSIQPFQPLRKDRVALYVCGPTVYDVLHIGNFRGAIFFNFFRNWLEHLGYRVEFMYNYTDVDDKIIQRAQNEGTDPKALSQKYIREFQKDFEALKLVPHEHNPKVTDHIPAVIRILEVLVQKGKAYAAGGEVIFSIESFPAYGRLSGKNIDELAAGLRVEVNPHKRNPLDFILWKPSKEGEPSWDSPWGKGRPGWHIECTAMIFEILGEQIDIHGGGIDLIFPHHENEIAQAEAASGKPYVRYWMHNNFIHFEDEKMSKSAGNVVSAREFLERYHPEILKYMMLSVHYRSRINFSHAQIHQSIAALAKIYKALEAASGTGDPDPGKAAPQGYSDKLRQLMQEAAEGLNDDLNTSVLFSKIFEVVHLFNAETLRAGSDAAIFSKPFLQWIRFFGQKMSLFLEPPGEFLKALEDILIREKKIDRSLVETKIRLRASARAGKDFAMADLLRKEIEDMGIEIKDGPFGTVWEVRKGDA